MDYFRLRKLLQGLSLNEASIREIIDETGLSYPEIKHLLDRYPKYFNVNMSRHDPQDNRVRLSGAGLSRKHSYGTLKARVWKKTVEVSTIVGAIAGVTAVVLLLR